MSAIKPALTADEWEEWHRSGRVGRIDGAVSGFVVSTKGTGFRGMQRVDIERSPHPCDTECHPMAALLLYGQPFGFTREMVAAIRSASGYLAHYAVDGNAGNELELCEQAADRIEALIPPEP